MRTRHDLEFMGTMLGVGRSQGYPLSDEVNDGMVDPVANTRAQSGILGLLGALPTERHPGPTPTRSDNEFMAGCLLGTNVGGLQGMRPWGLMPTERLAAAVAEGMADPIANARAQDRIADLLCDLPPGCYYAPARHERPRPPFLEPERPEPFVIDRCSSFVTI